MISSAKKKEERNADVMMTMMKILQLDLLNVGHNQSQKCFFFERERVRVGNDESETFKFLIYFAFLNG